MLLTVYYMAATWLQSWRLNSMRVKIAQLQKNRGSLILFGSQESPPQEGSAPVQSNSINCSFCINTSEARIGDLLSYVGNKLCLSIFPQQVVDTSSWIGVPNKKTLFPIELCGSPTAESSDEQTIHVVLEADFNSFNKLNPVPNCQVEEFGVARAWQAGEVLLLLVECDEEQLSKLTSLYMSNTITVGPGLELLRILSVDVKGKPCLLLNVDSIPAYNPASRRGSSVRKRAVAASQWQAHVSVLRSFSVSAAQAAKQQAPAPVDGHRAAMVVPGSGAGFTPLEEIKPLPGSEEPAREFSDPMTVATPTVEELPPLEDRSVSMTSLSAQPGSTGSSFGSLSRVSTDTLQATTASQATASIHSSLAVQALASALSVESVQILSRPPLPVRPLPAYTQVSVLSLAVQALASALSVESVQILSRPPLPVRPLPAYTQGTVVTCTIEDRSVSMTSLSAQPGSTGSSFGSLSRVSTDTLQATTASQATASIHSSLSAQPGSTGSSFGSLSRVSTDTLQATTASQATASIHSSLAVQALASALSVESVQILSRPPLPVRPLPVYTQGTVASFTIEDRSVSMTSLSAQPGSTGSSFGSLSRVRSDTLQATTASQATASIHSSLAVQALALALSVESAQILSRPPLPVRPLPAYTQGTVPSCTVEDRSVSMTSLSAHPGSTGSSFGSLSRVSTDTLQATTASQATASIHSSLAVQALASALSVESVQILSRPPLPVRPLPAYTQGTVVICTVEDRSVSMTSLSAQPGSTGSSFGSLSRVSTDTLQATTASQATASIHSSLAVQALASALSVESVQILSRPPLPVRPLPAYTQGTVASCTVEDRSVSMTSLSAQPGSTGSSFGSLSRVSTDTLQATTASIHSSLAVQALASALSVESVQILSRPPLPAYTQGTVASCTIEDRSVSMTSLSAQPGSTGSSFGSLSRVSTDTLQATTASIHSSLAVQALASALSVESVQILSRPPLPVRQLPVYTQGTVASCTVEDRSVSMTSLSAQPGSTGSSFGSLSRVSTDTLQATTASQATASIHSSLAVQALASALSVESVQILSRPPLPVRPLPAYTQVSVLSLAVQALASALSVESVQILSRPPLPVRPLPAYTQEDRSVSMTSLSAQPGSTGSSFGSLSRVSTDTLQATTASQATASIHSRAGLVNGSSGSFSSLRSATNTPKHIKVTVPHHADTTGKPPNIIVFSESSVSADSVRNTLQSVLHKHRYTITNLNVTQMCSPFVAQAALVVVCGGVPAPLAPILLQYVLQQGGSLLCLCSDLLGVFLPIFRTAEVRPDQLVTFSYSHWKHVQMLHHIFCYQQSSSAKFSSPDDTSSTDIPKSVEVLDSDNKLHTLSVRVLGVEETWQTPSLLMATEAHSGGKVVFSQVHLEADPVQYEGDGDKAKALKESNHARLEIFSDLLTTHLGLECNKEKGDKKYSVAYFLGSHELKQEFLSRHKNRLEGGNTLKLPDVTLKFCGKGVSPPEASANLMPVLLYTCPESFSTVSYFDNLGSQTLGRLVIFSDVMKTAMAVLSGPPLAHGLAVIPCQQTSGVGRGGTTWLSPDGCAMFGLQLHIPLKSELGRLLPFLQHTVAVAIVSSISSQPGLDVLELGVKWPNDIYAGTVKVGGLIITSVYTNGCAICNIGCGFNLDNKLPTVCINDMITQLNKASGQKLPLLTKEKYFAILFTELEKLLLMIEMGQQDKVIELYYKYWLHTNAEVDVTDSDGHTRHVTIVGVDEFGFLRVKGADKVEFTVQPDGNSFDMMAGLIAPKVIK
ncbi:mucin-17 [Macrosteles quadrilineatus]|uniref:mucin-17 n=1 Tax=Macrosteles quadrilineatus TaxID=74068 RepID=UPI0023E2905D|nr:mucin-17 [Macrosteles quadrilineatus]